MKLLKTLTYLTAFTLFIVPLFFGCVTNPYPKNEQGFYEKHYNCCGPIALEQALYIFFQKHGMTFKKAHTREEVSKLIQKEGMKLKEILSYFNREAICITWPSEMKYVLKKYGLKVTKVDGIDKLNPKEDIAIALVHGKFFTH